jgi:hypothetical protein
VTARIARSRAPRRPCRRAHILLSTSGHVTDQIAGGLALPDHHDPTDRSGSERGPPGARPRRGPAGRHAAPPRSWRDLTGRAAAGPVSVAARSSADPASDTTPRPPEHPARHTLRSPARPVPVPPDPAAGRARTPAHTPRHDRNSGGSTTTVPDGKRRAGTRQPVLPEPPMRRLRVHPERPRPLNQHKPSQTPNSSPPPANRARPPALWISSTSNDGGSESKCQISTNRR